MMELLIVLAVALGIPILLVYREVKRANVLAQQAITQRLAIAEELAKLTGEAGEQ